MTHGCNRLTLKALAALLMLQALAGAALAHQPAGREVRAICLDDGTLPTIDADLDDWEGVAPALGMADFTDLVSAAAAAGADFDVRVWVGWSDVHNRIYLAVEVADDIHQVDRPAGTAATRIFQDDDLEVFVDADHSGGQFADFSDLGPEEQLARNGTEASHFVLAGPHPDGDTFVNYSAAGWYALSDGPYTQARVAFAGTPGGPGISRYEMSLVPFDRINVTADFLSRGHDLKAGEVIGFNLELSDFDARSDLYDAKWSLSGGYNAFRLSERFTDLRLEPPAGATSVQDLSWGRIKASLRP